MLRDNLVELIEPMINSAGAPPLALSLHHQSQASDDRFLYLENPRPKGAESSLTENATSPFQAEPAHLRLENSKLPYDSFADKIYRALTRSGYDGSLRADTIQDFLHKSCTVGRLSQTFHTDLPRTFIAVESVSFNDVPIEKNGPPPFKQQYPGAGGIISFSHVGFDPTLHEAIVSVSFVCGGLCGSGNRYVLRKKSGRWEVVNKWMVWVS